MLQDTQTFANALTCLLHPAVAPPPLFSCDGFPLNKRQQEVFCHPAVKKVGDERWRVRSRRSSSQAHPRAPAAAAAAAARGTAAHAITVCSPPQLPCAHHHKGQARVVRELVCGECASSELFRKVKKGSRPNSVCVRLCRCWRARRALQQRTYTHASTCAYHSSHAHTYTCTRLSPPNPPPFRSPTSPSPTPTHSPSRPG